MAVYCLTSICPHWPRFAFAFRMNVSLKALNTKLMSSAIVCVVHREACERRLQTQGAGRKHTVARLAFGCPTKLLLRVYLIAATEHEIRTRGE